MTVEEINLTSARRAVAHEKVRLGQRLNASELALYLGYTNRTTVHRGRKAKTETLPPPDLAGKFWSAGLCQRIAGGKYGAKWQHRP